MKKGDRVMIDENQLENGGWDGLLPDGNDEGKDLKSYILENSDKVYRVKEYYGHGLEDDDVFLDDEFLARTRFYRYELVKVD